MKIRANIRHHYSSRHFIIPVIIYTLLYNLPKFFELTTVCPEDFPFSNFTDYNESEYSSLIIDSRNTCTFEERTIVANSIRWDCSRKYHCNILNLIFFIKGLITGMWMSMSWVWIHCSISSFQSCLWSFWMLSSWGKLIIQKWVKKIKMFFK